MQASETVHMLYRFCKRHLTTLVAAQGTVDAVIFLSQQAQRRAAQTLYSMVDVLRAGGMTS